MAGRKRSDQLRRMWRRNPHCHWCGKATQLLEPSPKRKVYPPNMATRDHLRSRFHPGRHEPTRIYPELRVVLACLSCNMGRGRAEEMAQPIEALQARAKNGAVLSRLGR